MPAGPPRASGQNLLGRLASRAAHDLNNALAILSGHLYLLRAAAETPEEACAAIEKAAEQVARLSKSLEQLASIGHGEPESFEWNDLALEAASDPIHGAGAITLDLGSGLPPARGRRPDIRRALDCLLLNSREAGAPGAPIRIVTAPLPGGGALLAVEDSGTGIPPEISGRVFTPLFSTSGQRGRGIGLTIVEAVAAAHGGACDFEPRQGGGTRFTIRIPG
jgi:two-component system NtrC family sensor kinase